MSASLDRAFYIRFPGHAGTEAALVGGVRKQRKADARLVVWSGPPLTRTLHVLGSAIRATGMFLVFSPLLLVVKVVIARVAGRSASDVVIPFFVLAVVLFFALLNLSMVVFFVRWLLRHRLPPPRFAEQRLAEGESPSASSSEGTKVRARGRVVPLESTSDDATDVVLQSADAVVAPGVIARLVEMRCFAVVPDDDTTPPLVVHDRWAPIVLAADPAPARFGAETLVVASAERGTFHEARVVRAGDLVELSGVVDAILPNADRFEIDGVATSLPFEGDEPYRGGGPRLALGVHGVVVQKL